jgi:C4-dicarboxylate transporter, DctM subunit
MLMLHARLSEDLFDFASLVFGRIKAGLGVATIAACAGFAAVTGSSAATVATVGHVAIPEMVRHGYSRRFAAGIVASGGTLGVMIPPSVVLVVYGVLAEVSIGRLLLAGILPGVVSAVIYSVYIALGAPRQMVITSDDQPDAEVLHRLRGDVLKRGGAASLQSMVVFLIVVAGIYTGAMTVTEAGMAAALVVVVLMTWRLRKQGLRTIGRALATGMRESAELSAMVFLLFVGGAIFSAFIVAARVPQDAATAILGLNVPPLVVVLVILLALIPLGMVLDSLSILLIVVPIAAPAISGLGVDMVWFGVLMVKMIELGLITPPLGLNAFVVAGVVPGLSVESVFRGLLPFAMLDVATILLLVLVPQISTWLPSLLS